MSWWRPSAAALVTIALLACGPEEEAGDPSAGDDLPDEIITGFVTEESDSGYTQWRLSAPVARRFNQKKVFLMESPTIQFFDENGQLKTTLVSENGEYSQETHDMFVYGNVVGTSLDGDVLETDTLRYLNVEDKIVSDSFVRLTRGGSVMTGWGLEADNRLSSVDIKRDVKASLVDDGHGQEEDGIDE
jgi:LPS export ABC transporter protein LptC